MFFSQKDLTATTNDPFAPGGTAVNTGSDPGKTPGMELPSGQWVVGQMVAPCLAKLCVLSNIYTVCVLQIHLLPSLAMSHLDLDLQTSAHWPR